jgi:ribosomal protein S18 acetylase RimI-like enzyme
MAARAVQIGFAHPRDAPALALMSRELIEAGLMWAYRPERMADLIRDPEGVVLVARDHQQAAGFAVMRFGDVYAHLVLLAVHATYQRRGIARQLLAWLTASAQVAGMMSIHVELRARNHVAYTMYRRAGFAETIRIPGYYQGREDAVRMIRMLRAPTATVVPGSLGL